MSLVFSIYAAIRMVWYQTILLPKLPLRINWKSMIFITLFFGLTGHFLWPYCVSLKIVMLIFKKFFKKLLELSDHRQYHYPRLPLPSLHWNIHLVLHKGIPTVLQISENWIYWLRKGLSYYSTSLSQFGWGAIIFKYFLFIRSICFPTSSISITVFTTAPLQKR